MVEKRFEHNGLPCLVKRYDMSIVTKGGKVFSKRVVLTDGQSPEEWMRGIMSRDGTCLLMIKDRGIHFINLTEISSIDFEAVE